MFAVPLLTAGYFSLAFIHSFIRNNFSDALANTALLRHKGVAANNVSG